MFCKLLYYKCLYNMMGGGRNRYGHGAEGISVGDVSLLL